MTFLRVVDAFTDRPFAGNPAAVIVLDRFPPEPDMQDLAREMNLSETAFVVSRPGAGHDLKWFTPTAEVDLCGHATLACAHILGGSATFHTNSGVLRCDQAEDGLIWMDLPADPVREIPAPASLAGLEVLAWGRGRSDLLATVASARALREYRPDLSLIAGLGSRTLIVTAPSDVAGVDCVSRVFGPAVGVPEDPVTGSAHCTLASYWSERTGRAELVGYQASARGGTVRMRTVGDRVLIGGRAVTVSEVRLLVPWG